MLSDEKPATDGWKIITDFSLCQATV